MTMFLDNLKITWALSLLLFETFTFSRSQDCSKLRTLCNARTNNNCDLCVQESPCCSWCYQKDFDGIRCDTYNSLIVYGCEETFIENYTFTTQEIKNENFRDVKDEKASAVLQFKPQEINIALRTGQPAEVDIKFKLSKNYPLDIYYLMDLSRSMLDVLNTFLELGKNITTQLNQITKYFKTGFGTCIDKTRLPFYPTAPERFENPCALVNSGDTCTKGYVFKHVSNFTDDIPRFLEVIKTQEISGNLDSLEGGLEAISQILICDTINWREKSRKLILLVTDSDLHMAGDGLLAGTVKRNNDICLVDGNGNYDEQLYDYPSLSEIRTLLLKRKTNLIIVTKNRDSKKMSSIDYFNKVKEVIHDVTFVGELKSDNTNILKLIRDGYNIFTKRANFGISKIESSIPNINEYLDIKILTDCNEGLEYMEVDHCDNVTEDKMVNLKLKIKLIKPLKEDKITLYVEEKGIHEKVKINLHIATCNCKNNDTKMNCQYGTSKCNGCICNEGWTGELCNEPCSDQRILCLHEGRTCSSNGYCICGKCDCDPTFTGEFCQFECPYTSGICSNHGKCIEGKCLCEDNYFGDSCEHTNRTDFCLTPGHTDVICSDHGNCLDDKCICDEGFTGIYCELCGNCIGLCNLYEECALDAGIRDKQECVVGNETIGLRHIEDRNVIQHSDSAYCFKRYVNETTVCEVTYTYMIAKTTGKTVIKSYVYCLATQQASLSIVLIIFLSVVLIGALLVIGIWKFSNFWRDRNEYIRFEKEVEQMSSREENPLYDSPIRKYENPMRKKDE